MSTDVAEEEKDLFAVCFKLLFQLLHSSTLTLKMVANITLAESRKTRTAKYKI
jgi:hypothetical protein